MTSDDISGKADTDDIPTAALLGAQRYNFRVFNDRSSRAGSMLVGFISHFQMKSLIFTYSLNPTRTVNTEGQMRLIDGEHSFPFIRYKRDGTPFETGDTIKIQVTPNPIEYTKLVATDVTNNISTSVELYNFNTTTNTYRDSELRGASGKEQPDSIIRNRPSRLPADYRHCGIRARYTIEGDRWNIWRGYTTGWGGENPRHEF